MSLDFPSLPHAVLIKSSCPSVLISKSFLLLDLGLFAPYIAAIFILLGNLADKLFDLTIEPASNVGNTNKDGLPVSRSPSALFFIVSNKSDTLNSE